MIPEVNELMYEQIKSHTKIFLPGDITWDENRKRKCEIVSYGIEECEGKSYIIFKNLEEDNDALVIMKAADFLVDNILIYRADWENAHDNI